MKSLLNPKWLYIINTAPLLLLFFILGDAYATIKTLLDPSTKELWAIFAMALGLLGTANFGYATYLLANKKRLPLAYGYIALLVHITFLYFYCCYGEDLLPGTIPFYMLSGNIFIYAFTFLMPTLAYSLFIIVVRKTPSDKDNSAAISFSMAVVVVITSFLLYAIAVSLHGYGDDTVFTHVMFVISILGATFFLFFLVKTIYILTINKNLTAAGHSLWWRVPIGIIIPLLGLLINNGDLQPYDYIGGVFGNFSSPWFYIIALVNGILLCLPALTHKNYRIALFFARSITFSYTFYFFLLFLPFLPLSIIAILLIGIGFLMLAPLLLFVMHVHDLNADYIFVRAWLSKTKATMMMIIGIMVMPVCITVVYVNQRHVLTQTLAYVYEPDYTKEYGIDTLSLKNTLNVIKLNKDRNDFGISDAQTPYLSSYYNYIVLDNLTLADDKIADIERIFFDKSDGVATSLRRIQENSISDVTIKGINHSSTFNSAKDQWESTINLQIKNNGMTNLAEYATAFSLPDGCWINDYYLLINNKKEKGLLAEKKAATWLYTQITNTNRDPGILFYTSGNNLTFRVFPFKAGEIRQTGITFIHKDPVTLTIDDKQVTLGTAKKETGSPDKIGSIVYVAAAQKAVLKKVLRKPYYHFIIDVSKNAKANTKGYINAINDLVAEREDMGKPQISFAGTYTTTLAQNINWQEALKGQEFTGGFYAEHAIKKVLTHTYNHTTATYPVIVLVTESIDNAIIPKDFSDLKFTYPESDVFYSLNGSGILSRHLLTNNPKDISLKNERDYSNKHVLAWPQTGAPKRYIRNDSLAEILLAEENIIFNDDTFTPHNWLSGLALQGEYMQQTLHPETSGSNWSAQVRHSSLSKIIMPHTSFIVLENQAQKEVLKRKQDDVLTGNKSLDTSDDNVPLPKLWHYITIVLMLIFAWLRHKGLSSKVTMPKQK